MIYRERSLLKLTNKSIQVARIIADTYPKMDCEQDGAEMVFYLDGKPVLMMTAEEE